ncbi:pirin family protein [Pelagibius sp. Alg239-R121]|uniref:pirin family protein n=1 Tax=Pelagibius sp. Alg239-R121 TaxID=2993448 RepID=UPI0024A707FC|nr:pirin family protein [Pelagibius sp. Alg239-R121]
MIDVAEFNRLGRFENDWLTARHHFSFGSYFDPSRNGVGPLIVWNDDAIAPGTGFDLHGHRDMEIITYVRSGAITHQDHLGNQGRTEAGDVQVMTAGKGIMHAEYNREDEETTLFQIWIRPAIDNLQPRWDQSRFPKSDRAGILVPLASGRSRHQGALEIHQDAALLGATLTKGQSLRYDLGQNRQGYLVAASGEAVINGTPVQMRDGAAIRQEDHVDIEAVVDTEILLADLPAN